MRTTPRLLDLLLGAAALVVFLHPAAPAAQSNKKPEFDIKRFSDAGHDWFETFHVKKYESLRQVLDEGKVAEDTRVLVTDTAGGKLALLTDQMSFHHIAQGHAGGRDWMATF
ncbi:MAG: hypothetical protein HYU27_05400 [Acidobacteria bacterium]|nr:hypothetical protein [Acidobacteriota bacterium]